MTKTGTILRAPKLITNSAFTREFNTNEKKDYDRISFRQ